MLGSPLKKYACADFIIKSSEHWYNYPLKRLGELPEDQAIIIKFDDLVQDAEKTVLSIYQQLGFTVTEEFNSHLKIETKQARNHRSQHLYSLSDMGICRQEMIDRFGLIIERFDFDEEI